MAHHSSPPEYHEVESPTTRSAPFPTSASLAGPWTPDGTGAPFLSTHGQHDSDWSNDSPPDPETASTRSRPRSSRFVEAAEADIANRPHLLSPQGEGGRGSYGSQAPILKRSGTDASNSKLSILSGKKGMRTHKQMKERWGRGIHWFVPTSMVVTLALGVMGAIGHHLFNASLHHKPATDQRTMQRIGTGLAFITKALLVGAIVVAYRQRLWYSVRQKPISLKGLDAMFHIVEDPTWFLSSKEIVKKAKIVVLMALATWLIPLASVLSPGSLTAAMVRVPYPNKVCDKVGYLNFTAESWRTDKGASLAYFAQTPPEPGPEGPDADWYDQPSTNARRIAYLAVYGNELLEESKLPCTGFNCTYEVQFEAPHYNCSKADWTGNLRSNETNLGTAPFNRTELVPWAEESAKNYIYIMKTDPKTGKLASGHQENKDNNTYTNQGVFDYENKFWFYFAKNTSKPSTEEDTNSDRWKFKLEPNLWQCVHQKAHYTVNTTVNTGYQKRINRTAIVKDGVTLLKDNDKMKPLPFNKEGKEYSNTAYREFAAYHTIGDLARGFLDGDLTKKNSSWNESMVITHTDLSNTYLVGADSLPVDDFIKNFEKFYHQFVLSFMSSPNLAVFAWQNDTDCPSSRFENLFVYKMQDLWIGYSIAIFASTTFVILGYFAIQANGIASETTFSTILTTTRNRQLDRIVGKHEGACLGAVPLHHELESTQLQFGVLEDLESFGEGKKTAFGFPEQVKPISKEVLARRNTDDMELNGNGAFFSGAGLGAIPTM